MMQGWTRRGWTDGHVKLVPTRLENSLTTQAPAAEVLQEGGTATDGVRH